MPTLKFVAGLFVFLVVSDSAHAGWITMTNETDHVVVIQETSGPLNKPVRGKSVKLQPGETYKEFQLLAGRRTVVITAPKNDKVMPAVATLNWDSNDTPFQLVSSGQTLKFESPATERKSQVSKSTSSK